MFERYVFERYVFWRFVFGPCSRAPRWRAQCWRAVLARLVLARLVLVEGRGARHGKLNRNHARMCERQLYGNALAFCEGSGNAVEHQVHSTWGKGDASVRGDSERSRHTHLHHRAIHAHFVEINARRARARRARQRIGGIAVIDDGEIAGRNIDPARCGRGPSVSDVQALRLRTAARRQAKRRQAERRQNQ